MVVAYYIKLFRKGADRHNGILMFSPSSRRDKKDLGVDSRARTFGQKYMRMSFSLGARTKLKSVVSFLSLHLHLQLML